MALSDCTSKPLGPFPLTTPGGGDSNRPMSKDRKILLLIILLLVILAVFLLYYSSSVFLQLFLAFALAYILNPLVQLLERRGVQRLYGILTVFSLSAVVCGGFIVFLVISVASEFSNVQLNLPAYIRHLYEITPDPVKAYLGIETPDKLAIQVNVLVQNVRSVAPDILKPLLAFMQRAVTSTAGMLLTLLGYLIIPVYLFYLLFDLPHLKAFIESYIPKRYQAPYSQKMAEIDSVLSGFIRGQLSVCVLLAILYSVGLSVIGIDLAIAIGTLAGVAFIIPYVGTIIGICLSVIMALLKFNDILHPMLCLGWFGFVQLLEGTIITPKMVGDTVGLHPLVAIVSLLIGGQIFGVVGMLLAVPVTAVMQVFLRSLTSYYRNSEFFREG